jgi:probable HAF family extracellular repeat protein
MYDSCRFFALLLLSFLANPPSGAAVEATFEGLGHLAGGYSAAYNVSGDGSVVVGTSTAPNGTDAFFWQAGVMTGLGARAGQALGVSTDGSIVVGLYFPNPSGLRRSFRWSASGLVDLGMRDSAAYDVSNDGSVVVGLALDPPGYGAFRWVDGTVSFLGSGAGWARAVSGDGSVIVGEGEFGNGVEAFRWTEGAGVDPLGDLSGGTFRSIAYDVSEDGSVIVGVGESESGQEAFRWTATDGMVSLGVLPGRTVSAALGVCAVCVSGDGSLIVGSATRSPGSPPPALTRPFVWLAESGLLDLQHVLETIHRLDLSGWELTSARAVSHDGSIVVGTGINPDGETEGWRATLPEFVPIQIDITPGSETNPVSLAASGVTVVALLGSGSLDVDEIDGATISMGRAGARLKHRKGPHRRDVNRDGLLDLVAHFQTHEIGLALGDEEACIRAETLDGELVGGCDVIDLVGCGRGFALAFVIPPMVGVRRRLRRRASPKPAS